MLLFSLVIGGVFSTLAALSAFLITYGEYLKHYPDRRKPFLMAVKTSLAAFAVFMVLSVLLMSVFAKF
jgi:hypothetical protein